MIFIIQYLHLQSRPVDGLVWLFKHVIKNTTVAAFFHHPLHMQFKVAEDPFAHDIAGLAAAGAQNQFVPFYLPGGWQAIAVVTTPLVGGGTVKQHPPFAIVCSKTVSDCSHQCYGSEQAEQCLGQVCTFHGNNPHGEFFGFGSALTCFQGSSPRMRRFNAASASCPAKSSNALSVKSMIWLWIKGAPSAAPCSGCLMQHSHSRTAQPS